MKISSILAGGALAFGMASGAKAIDTSIESYSLGNHPDGNARPPLYGLRIDNMIAPGINTWSFTGNGASVSASYDSGTGNLSITGSVYGGLDGGSSYTDPHLGTLSFTYYGLTAAGADDDLWTTDEGTSVGYGTLIYDGTTYELAAKSNGTYSFRFGDENDDNGHRGYDGIAGWGWLYFREAGTTAWSSHGDFLFTATPDEETPGVPDAGSSLVLLGSAIGLMAGMRPRQS